MHSHVAGIAWISAALVFIAGLAIFLPKDIRATAEDSSKTAQDTAILTKMEDSVYRTRRKHGGWKKDERDWRQHHTEGMNRGAGQTRQQGDVMENEKGNAARPVRRQPLMVELNSADTTTLQLLRGIGPTYASRIVRYRERLGGFTSKEQLLEVYGFTPELLNRIEPYITVDTHVVSKISINSVPLKQLIKHPYIEYYQARDIVNLRNQGARFNTADDLRAVPSMADSTLERMLPYLLFD